MTDELHDFFVSYYRRRPVNATFTGVHDYDDRLPDWSPDGLEAVVDEMRALRSSLVASCSQPRDSASSSGAGRQNSGSEAPDGLRDIRARDRELAIAFLDIQIAELEGSHFQRRNPSLAVGEAAFGVISLMTRPFAHVTARAEAAAARLAAMPAFLEGARRSCTAAVPAEWRLKTLRECEGLSRLLVEGVPSWIAVAEIPASEARRLTTSAATASTAVERHREWLECLPSPDRDEYSSGPELFDLLLRRGHWCDRSRDDLTRETVDALSASRARLEEQAQSAGGWPQVQERLLEDHPGADDYLHAYERTWTACRRAAEANRLVSWPEYPIRYVPIPVQTRTAAPFLYYLFYRSPAPFDRLPVHEYVVTPVDGIATDEQRRRLRANNHSVITLNHVVHHGGIGHHVQNYYAYQGASEIGRIAAVDCASRIGMFSGGTMAEGWACYATDLMDEIGFLTRDQSLAQQHTRARLAARAVVDLGLHAGTLGFDAAIRVYCDQIGMPADAARAEVCKNSMFPGTALMYWLGTEALHRLRREHAKGLTLRDFHDRVLAFGSIPVPLIAQVWS
jgi:hypothetical protein